MASKLWVHEPDTFFFEAAREISEKWNFFVKRSVPENFQWENFLGQVPTESLRTQDSENVYERLVQQMFVPVLVARRAPSMALLIPWNPPDVPIDPFKLIIFPELPYEKIIRGPNKRPH